MENQHTILSVLQSIQQRPAMYIYRHTNFGAYSAYVDGFLFGMVLCHNASYLRNLSEAFAEKYNGSEQIPVSVAIDELNSNDNVKIEKYMEFLIEFFSKNNRII